MRKLHFSDAVMTFILGAALCAVLLIPGDVRAQSTVSNLPAGVPIAAADNLYAEQGSGCPAAPCAGVKVTGAMVKTWAQSGTFPMTSLPRQLSYGLGVVGIVITSTGDKGSIAIPSSITKWRVSAVQAFNCTVAPTGTGAVGLWTGAGATGTQVGAVATAQLATLTTPATLAAGTAPGSTATFTGVSQIFINVSALATTGGPCSFTVTLFDLTGL